MDVMDYTDLHLAQEVVGNRIERTIVNFNKLGTTKQTVAAIESRINLLQDNYEKFSTQHIRISKIATEEEKRDEYFVNDYFNAVSDSYDLALDHLNELLLSKCPTLSQTTRSSTEKSLNEGMGNERFSTYRLPQITLPRFNGSYTEWESFRDLFNSLIHTNQSLSGVEKLHYLKTNVEGEAASFVKHVAVTEANYEATWTEFKNRFNNTRSIVNSYLQILFDIPKIQTGSILKDLKNLLDQVLDVRSALISLNRPINAWEDMFIFWVIKKLDAPSLTAWELKLEGSKDMPTFEQLEEFLSTRVKIFEAVDRQIESSQNKNTYKSGEKDNVTSSKVHQVTTSENVCLRCKNKHPLYICGIFKKDSISTRRDFVMKEKLCFNCLKKGHMSSQCRSEHHCSTCGRRHHSLLHIEQDTGTSSSCNFSKATAKNVSSSVKINDKKEDGVSSSAHHVSTSRNFTKAILPTAMIKVYGPSGQSIIVRALLDQAAQASCVSERVVQELKLKKRRIVLDLFGVGEMKDESRQNTVHFRVSLINSTCPKIQVTAIVLPPVSSYSVRSTNLDKPWPLLTKLKLADPDSSSEAPIDVLLGSSEYALVLMKGLHKGPNSTPIVQQTMFGWIVSGAPDHSVSAIQNLSINHLSTLPVKPSLSPEDQSCEEHFTATYGTACAPYHAIRVLRQLSEDEGHRFPQAAEVLCSDFYVDDALFGADSLEEIICIRDQLISLLSAGGFTLRKWASNSIILLEDIPRENHGHALEKIFSEDDKLKVLGINWLPHKDVFTFSYNCLQYKRITKRTFLSTLAGIYDPLGWLAPFTIIGKILMQKLWKEKIDWDDDLSSSLEEQCIKFLNQIPQVNSILLNRWIGKTKNANRVEVHGFGDASDNAYAAVVYLRVSEPDRTTVSLVYAKTKVAPLKQISIPRLELCAATLVVKAIKYTQEAFKRVLREQHWVLNARSIARKIAHNCLRCRVISGKLHKQLMGQLPIARLNHGPPFAHVGVDYAGPLQMRLTAGRGYRKLKCYVAIFVCMSVRTVHIELVTDCTSQAFLAAFDRFVSRRGLPEKVYSDNGTSFKDAENERLRNFQKLESDPQFQAKLADLRIAWEFIPPNAPHFGGIWEAGVKSIKHHLRRVLGQCTPTMEELQTLLCGIEAILNSRPLTPLSDNPDDLDALTPGHFLRGGPLVLPPTPSLLERNVNYLSRWQNMQYMLQSFWRVWSTDFLNSLQLKTKWKTAQTNLKIGDLVLVSDRNAPPTMWKLGRIISVRPGKDGLVRVVEVRTASSILTRAVTQLCKLPVQSPSKSKFIYTDQTKSPRLQKSSVVFYHGGWTLVI